MAPATALRLDDALFCPLPTLVPLALVTMWAAPCEVGMAAVMAAAAFLTLRLAAVLALVKSMSSKNGALNGETDMNAQSMNSWIGHVVRTAKAQCAPQQPSSGHYICTTSPSADGKKCVSGKNQKFWPQMTLDDDRNGTLVIFGDDINL